MSYSTYSRSEASLIDEGKGFLLISLFSLHILLCRNFMTERHPVYCIDCCVGTWWQKGGPVYEFLFCFLFAYFVCVNLMRWSWFILEMGCVLSCLLACLVIWRIHDPFISGTTITILENGFQYESCYGKVDGCFV